MIDKNKYFTEKFSYDLKAAVTVFLVAIPLSLGIAVASNMPAISGLIAGIIGGIVVGFLSGSSLSVSGCAAGLVPVILLSVSKLGSIELFFTAVILAGCFQYIFGLLRAGIIAHYIPFSVLKGMLAAIGIIIIFKQLPHLIGYHDELFDDTLTLTENYGVDFYNQIWDQILLVLNNISLGALMISVLTLLIIYICSSDLAKKNKVTKAITEYIPCSLIAIVLAVILNNIFFVYLPEIALTGVHLVNIPSVFNHSSFRLPFDLNGFTNIVVYKYAIMLAIIGSIETLLSIEACDKLDPKKRVTPTSKELKAQGVGNLLSGLLGGLPITSVIIRTSVNIENNAQSKMSTIIHGVFILLSLLFLAPLINQIPLAALAAILIVTGYKLTSEKLIRDMFKKGAHHFVPFVTTIIAILLTDLLRGVFWGLVVSIFFILRNYYTLQNIKIIKNDNAQDYRIVFGEYTTFLSKANIAKALNEIPEQSNVTLDFSNCTVVDYEIEELINDYISSSINKNINVCTVSDYATNINFSVS
ncbi:MAG: SulP family inorganic anion transporter [Gammaproteobacteria bacterium]|nr:SulP family inorganic anion transporter [Gammaproteobacteria bacterium]